ncbi:hypothetical protein JCM19379_10760 [Methyloparacoccus murrellii]
MQDLLTHVFSSQWRVLFFFTVVLLAVAELGFRRGLRVHETSDEACLNQLGTLQGSVLGLLALLLGFTFAMAMQRYEVRRDLVVQEANAIGSTYLLAAFLPEPHRGASEQLLRRYVDVRLGFYGAGYDSDRIASAEQAATAIQRQLWNHAVAAGKLSDSPLTANFVNSLGRIIDLDTTRLAAMRNRIPLTVWVLLLGVAGCGCWATGYGAGATGRRTAFALTIVPVLIAAVITVLADFSATRRGLIGISQESLVALQQSLSERQP